MLTYVKISSRPTVSNFDHLLSEPCPALQVECLCEDTRARAVVLRTFERLPSLTRYGHATFTSDRASHRVEVADSTGPP